MNKGLEALEGIKILVNKTKLTVIDCALLGKRYDIIEKELKALEVVIKNLKIEVYHSRHRETGYEMSMQDSDNNDMFTMITKEEYELLKEIL